MRKTPCFTGFLLGVIPLSWRAASTTNGLCPLEVSNRDRVFVYSVSFPVCSGRRHHVMHNPKKNPCLYKAKDRPWVYRAVSRRLNSFLTPADGVSHYDIAGRCPTGNLHGIRASIQIILSKAIPLAAKDLLVNVLRDRST